MCDYYLQRMEGDQAGDLTDIVRAVGAMPVGAADLPSTATEWQLPAEPILFPPPQSSSDGAGPSGDAFGDPFSGLPDPFSSDYPSSSGGAADFFDGVPGAVDVGMVMVDFVDAAVGGGDGCGGGGGGGGRTVDAGGVLDMRKPILPRGMQMPGVSPLPPRAIRPYPVMSGDTVKLGVPIAGQAVGPCAFDAVAGLQMSSPLAGGIKRRKNQARKVVCIQAPAAAAAGWRNSGEVVPSDLWAWRKYGQKPIKGSPYPRGYYRCSSSKGCSARKQVERSRTDPNMLVITYTSEHNHPWPTQRNAHAGSMRSHHAKNSSSSSAAAASKNNSSHNQQKRTVKAEPNDQAAAATATTTATTSTTTAVTTSTSNTPSMAVKEEAVVGSEMEKGVDDTSVTVDNHSDLMQQMFSQSYRPMIPEAGHHDDFFADLAELETDLIFSMEYMESRPGGDPDKEKAIAKDLDPFMLDWTPTAAVAASAGSSFEQGQRGL